MFTAKWIKRYLEAPFKYRVWPIAIGIFVITALVSGHHLLIGLFNRPNYQSLAFASLSHKTEILIFGSSHVVTGINPVLISDKTVTIGAAGMNYSEMGRLSQKILTLAPNISLIAIEVAPELSFKEERFLDLHNYGVFLPTSMLLTNPAAYVRDRLYAFYNFRMVPRHMPDLFANRDRSDEHRPGYLKRVRTGSKKELDKDSLTNVRTISAKNKVQSTHPESLANLVNGLKGEHRNIIFLAMPKYKTFWKMYTGPNLEDDKLTLEILAAGSAFCDYRREELEDESFFDSTHLNEVGANIISEKFANCLRNVDDSIMSKSKQ